jgi:magnesium transporter
MSRFSRQRLDSVRKPPGTLTYVGPDREGEVTIDVIDYNESTISETPVTDVSRCTSYRNSDTVSWINVNGVKDTDLIGRIGSMYGIHPLLLEDIVDTTLRPKVEDLDTYFLVVLKMLSYDDGVSVEQVSLVVGERYVLSFQEKEGDVFEEVRERIRKNRGIIRASGSDYLAYSLVDAIVDNYFSVLESISEKIEGVEEAVTDAPSATMSKDLHFLRRELLLLRRSLWPLREAVSTLMRTDSALIEKTTDLYLKDVYDHTVEIIDVIETFREQVHSLMDTYLSSVSNSMNSVMKVLTIIATIFIPLTFLSGIYGMNFLNMPELKWRFGYPVVLAVMGVTGIFMFLYFKRKRWL